MTELLLVLVVVAGIVFVLRQRRAAESRELSAAHALAQVRTAAEEDVTRFGEELQQLHIDTLTTELDAPMRQDYQRALDSYENAKQLLTEARLATDIKHVTSSVEDGRYARACVLARQSGDPLPQRRPPCFFNPAHGPAQEDIEWSPPGGVARDVPVCSADAERIRGGAEPDTRMVRRGNRMVPWYQGGPAFASYADGYYGSYATNGLFPAFLIGAMMGTTWNHDVIQDPTGGAGSDWSGQGGSDGWGDPGWGDPGWGDGGGGGGWDGGGWGGGFDGGFDGGGGGDGGF
jgi:hypothetical protein